MTTDAQLRALRERWSPAKPHERGSAQAYVIELCEAIGVERPRPPGSGYEFELTIDAITTEGRESKNYIDLWKADHFALEAKDHDAKKSNDLLLRRAFGQVRNYVAHTPGDPPPYIMVLDVARTLVVWDRWSGSYGGYAAGRRIDLPTLHERPEDVALLRDIWENPRARDPRARAQAVTTDIAGRLARLAASLEGRGYEQERVARFLMRVVFSCFAEDIGLLPQEAFRHTVTEAGIKGSPEQFSAAITALWRAMDEGGLYGFLRLLRFNGHFFREPDGGPAEALPLTPDDLVLLQEAAKADWAHVEPSIFGTLLVRALDPRERHRLGAEYTPRSFIERLVRPTVDEPLRERWTAVQAEVLQLRETGKKRDRERAVERLSEFHAWLRGLRFLDPAAGSGNFLYVTMHMVKRLELEVIRELEHTQGLAQLRFDEVGPWQFFAIEVKPWAREIAELVLWIGFHQFWREHHSVQPSEPILRDTGTMECRDAVLTWDGHPVEDPARARADTRRARGPGRAGGRVADPLAVMRYFVYPNARPAEPWPQADFIVGNPPYIGRRTQRESLGDGYVDALRAAYPNLSNNVDYVMYWWHRAAAEVAAGRTIRAGLITTYRITSLQNRPTVEEAAEAGAHVVWAAPNHPWIDDKDSAAIRVAMTVLDRQRGRVRRVLVDDAGCVTGEAVGDTLNSDLTIGVDVAAAAKTPLAANVGMCFIGPSLVGRGFVLQAAEARQIMDADARYAAVIHPYWPGDAFAGRPDGASVIDFATMAEDEAASYEVPFEIVRSRVKPERDRTDRKTRRINWWRFGEPAPGLRRAIAGLRRYIGTSLTERRRTFHFVPVNAITDNSVVCIATDDAFHLGVLSSEIHRLWARRAGGRLGVGNDPRYNKTVCFDPYPFPDPSEAQRADVAGLAEQIDAHRRRALGRNGDVGIGDLYSVVDRMRAGEELTGAEQRIADLGALTQLRDLHDRLDAATAAAYGWPWPLEEDDVLQRLVALHEARLEEESRGLIRWLRPGYQRPATGDAASVAATQMDIDEPAAAEAPVGTTILEWPADAVGQITVLRQMATHGPVSVAEAVARFRAARPDLVARHLETLAILGEVQEVGEGRYAGAAVAA